MSIQQLVSPTAFFMIALGAPFAALVANAGVVNVPVKAPCGCCSGVVRHCVIHPHLRGGRAIGRLQQRLRRSVLPGCWPFGYQGNQRHDRGSSRTAPGRHLQPGRAGHQRDARRQSDGHQMEDAIRRSVERQFPELTGGYHLPRFGRVVAVPDAPAAPGLCDDFRPRYGVDVQVLLPDGEPDPDLPILAGLPLPAPMGGQEAGMFGFPEENTTVVVCFAYGLPHKPFIQQILPHGLSLPRVPKGDQVWQHSEACQQRVDADGNWLRQTDGKIQDKAIEREVEDLDNAERFQNHTRTVDDHSTESVGGVKKIEAMGALKLLSGGSASLAAVDDLHQATGRDLNLVVGQKLNATVGGDLQEQIQGLRSACRRRRPGLGRSRSTYYRCCVTCWT